MDYEKKIPIRFYINVEQRAFYNRIIITIFILKQNKNYI